MVFIKLGLLSSVPCQRAMIAVPCRICKAPQIRKRRLLGMHLEPQGTCGLLPRRILTRFLKQGKLTFNFILGNLVFIPIPTFWPRFHVNRPHFIFRELNYISFEQYFCSEYRVLRNSSSSPDPFLSHLLNHISLQPLKKNYQQNKPITRPVCGLQAFKKLLRDWHPDKNADRVQVCTAVFQFLQKARHLFKSERRWLDWPEVIWVVTKTLVICC